MARTGRKKLPQINTIEQIVELIEKCSNILVLSGAGISVSAGIPDFRSAETGIYADLKQRYNLSDPSAMFDLRYFIEDPSLFYSFCGEICAGFDDEKIKYFPTASHYFIKALESKGKLLRNYTQNIDMLEIRAGIQSHIACHGSFVSAACIFCGFQVNGKQIESHIFEQRVPLCPRCLPNKSDLNPSECLQKGEPIICINRKGNLLQVRLPKVLCSAKYLQAQCPILFSFGDEVLEKALFDADELSENEEDVNMNFRFLILKCSDSDILRVCGDAIMQWLKNLPSFGVIKPDIVFFHESLSANYHKTIEQDIEKCDLLLVMGTSLKVAPVSAIPKEIPSDVPAVLMNRERVGYPNEFDVHLLGNCDDICSTLIHKLKWDFVAPRKMQKMEENKEMNGSDCEMKETKQSQMIKAIATVKVDAKLVDYKHYEPNYYVFPNGELLKY